MKKKFLAMFLVVGAVLPMSLILSACDVHSHTYDNWSYDQTIHWKECADCGEQAEIGSHTIEEDWSNDNESHWKGCTVCGYKQGESAHVYDNNCDTDCNICGYIRTAPHVFDDECDTTCNDCSYVREIEHTYGDVWSCNETIHWKECTICSEKLEIAHVYDNNCDEDCNVCGYVRTAPHTFDNACDTTCNDCNYTRTIEHSYKQTYFYDEDYHWHECEYCGSVQNEKTSHEYYVDCDTTCNICGAEREK